MFGGFSTGFQGSFRSNASFGRDVFECSPRRPFLGHAPFHIRKTTAAIWPYSKDSNRVLLAFPSGDGGGKPKAGEELANLECRQL